MNQLKRNFIALAAPSGGGKTTLCKMLLEKYPGRTVLSISYTTRLPRGQERAGVDYHFVSREEFESLIKEGALVEWAEVHGQYYGTSKKFLEEQSAGGKAVLLDIDVQGVESLKKIFGDKCISFFILPPSLEELEKRLRSRKTESEHKLQARLAAAKKEMDKAPDFDYRIVNCDLSKSFAELCSIVEREVGLAQ